MALTLFVFDAHPDRIAVSKTGAFLENGAFFLDFTRPLEVTRWCGILNRWIGPAVGLLVPVVHEGERRGGYVIGVDRSAPYFADLRSLWKKRYPSKEVPPIIESDELKIIADFAEQFPEDCQ